MNKELDEYQYAAPPYDVRMSPSIHGPGAHKVRPHCRECRSLQACRPVDIGLSVWRDVTLQEYTGLQLYYIFLRDSQSIVQKITSKINKQSSLDQHISMSVTVLSRKTNFER